MMPPTLQIRLLGDFSLVYGDEQVSSINTPRLHSLLAYLVLHRDAHPLDEGAYRGLMRVLALNNDRAGALRVYHSCVTTLQRELGVEPSRPTREAYESLLRLGAPAAAAPRTAMRDAGLPLIGRGPELIVGTARAEEVPPHHALRTLLLHLRSTLHVAELMLQPLDAAETAKLAAHIAGRELDVGALDELWQKRILREQGANSYDFTHDKLREVAYAELSAPQRQRLHRRIAHALERTYADDPAPISGQSASQ